jgi:hypothetical protein
MPNKDGTGPEGKGPMTGRGLGRCNNDKENNNSKRGQGRGLGMRRRAMSE